MKTNRQRELAFLQYLDALDSGDSESISHFLEAAEEDERLEKMMLDYHQQNQAREAAPIDTPVKTIIPFKLKREQTRHMIQIVGTSAVAALILITVGVIGLLLGMRQNNTAIADAQQCTVRLANDDNTVTLMGGDDIESPVRVGVNNPFTVYLDTGQTSEGYQVIFEGLRAIIAYDDLSINGDCSQQRSLTVYPQGEIGEICDIQMNPIELPMSIINYKQWLDTPIVLDQAVDGFYPVTNDNFTGRLPVELVHIQGNCLNYPLLYLPPRSDNNRPDETSNDDKYHLEVNSLRVYEQQFEEGIMFYIAAVDEVWVAYRYNTTRHWDVSSGTMAEHFDGRNNPYYERKAPEGFFVPENPMFKNIWQYWGGYVNYIKPDELNTFNQLMGWAITEPATYMAKYETIYPYTHSVNSHIIETSTGEFYQFYETSNSWNIVDNMGK